MEEGERGVASTKARDQRGQGAETPVLFKNYIFGVCTKVYVRSEDNLEEASSLHLP